MYQPYFTMGAKCDLKIKTKYELVLSKHTTNRQYKQTTTTKQQQYKQTKDHLWYCGVVMGGDDVPRPCLENLIAPKIKTNKQQQKTGHKHTVDIRPVIMPS